MFQVVTVLNSELALKIHTVLSNKKKKTLMYVSYCLACHVCIIISESFGSQGSDIEFSCLQGCDRVNWKEKA